MSPLLQTSRNTRSTKTRKGTRVTEVVVVRRNTAMMLLGLEMDMQRINMRTDTGIEEATVKLLRMAIAKDLRIVTNIA